MGIIKPANLAHPFLAVMFTTEEHLRNILGIVQGKLGDFFASGPIYRVSDFTDYYAKEFGRDLHKQFYVFQKPVTLENFHRIKIWTNQLELDHSIAGAAAEGRWINLDPGYLEPSKLVLFSTKNYSHRIYIGEGIYAETTLIYERGNFKLLPWTYPDYYWESNRAYLLEMRNTIVQMQRQRLA